MVFKKSTRSSRKKVFVAMSGGVDSSVAAALLKDAGYEVVGVTMCFGITRAAGHPPSCCGPESIEDARRAAAVLGIPHYVLNFSEDIRRYVIDDFCSEYFSGRTPNPCVRCNRLIKFGTLYQKVRALGADYLATGHYARIVKSRGVYRLKKGADCDKDQSYFLYSMERETLPHVLFPVGDKLKSDVRRLARGYGLNTAHKKESQDICFVPGGGYKQFIRDVLGASAFLPGPFRDMEGEVVGEHRGIANYTIGQRDKLGLALGYPVYVVRIDKETNTIVVGPKECLASGGLIADQGCFPAAEKIQENLAVSVRIRYNAPDVRARLSRLSGGRFRIDFIKPQMAVTPGQSVVCYRRDTVLGGGLIRESLPVPPKRRRAVTPGAIKTELDVDRSPVRK